MYTLFAVSATKQLWTPTFSVTGYLNFCQKPAWRWKIGQFGPSVKTVYVRTVYLLISTENDEFWRECGHERGTKKKSESPIGIEPMTSQTPGAVSADLRELMESKVIWLSSYVTGVMHTGSISTVEVILSSGKWIKIVNFKLGNNFFLCPTLESCWSIHLSHFVTKLKVHHFYSLIRCTNIGSYVSTFPTNQNDFNLPSSLNLYSPICQGHHPLCDFLPPTIRALKSTGLTPQGE